MIKDKIPDYFDMVTRLIDDEYGEDNVGYSQRKNDSPPKFPHMYFHQIGGSDKCPTLSGTHEAAEITIEITAYHNKGIAQARKFANFIRRIMTDPEYRMYFECNLFEQMDNIADSSVQMFEMRYFKTVTEKE